LARLIGGEVLTTGPGVMVMFNPPGDQLPPTTPDPSAAASDDGDDPVFPDGTMVMDSGIEPPTTAAPDTTAASTVGGATPRADRSTPAWAATSSRVEPVAAASESMVARTARVLSSMASA
jgi:hypothetical protein